MGHVSQPGLELAKRADMICSVSCSKKRSFISNPFDVLEGGDNSEIPKQLNCIGGILVIQALKPHNYPLVTVRHSIGYEGITEIISHWLGASIFGDFLHMNLRFIAENRSSYAKKEAKTLQEGEGINRLMAKAAYLTAKQPVRQAVVRNADGSLETHRIALMDNDLLLENVAPGRTMDELTDLASRKVEEAMSSVV